MMFIGGQGPRSRSPSHIHWIKKREKMSIIKVDALPEITRQSVASGLILEIREALKESFQTGQAFKIDDLFEDKDFHNMQQRVRTQARKLGLNATVRRAKEEYALYFMAIDPDIKKSAKTLDDLELDAVE